MSAKPLARLVTLSPYMPVILSGGDIHRHRLYCLVQIQASTPVPCSQGTYAKASTAAHRHREDGGHDKVLDKERLIATGMVEQIKREITILKHLHHPHVVQLHEVMSSKGKIFMVMELITGGSCSTRSRQRAP